ncbi:MAG TPA: type I polyketide synthase, partial [Ktedonobacteraceae bacterium]
MHSLEETDKQRNGLEIAIIGLAGRFPGARNVEELWHNIQRGVCSITTLSDEELLASGVRAAKMHDPAYVRARGVLEDIELFDAAFFGYSPREAEIMDPQQRLFLECAYEALENAGYDHDRCDELIGVYAGTGMNSYLLENLYSNPKLIASIGISQLVVGSDKDYLTTRVSYKLNLKGPSLGVNTACSTSLVAVHLACRSLLNGECDIALAGGVSISVPQKAGYVYLEGGVAAPDGVCRAFDARAQGAVPGSGVGIVVLKRLEDALNDGDTIYAVIKGSAINNDGSQKVGFTAPGVDGQARAIRDAHLVAEVEPETITYVEAHGTGTPLGDPIEIAALTQAFRASTTAKGFCAIGSVKTNLGHLDAAAGVTGLLKTVGALRAARLPPSLHFEQPNPRIDFVNSPFYVNTKLTEWPGGPTPRRAGVSSFGIGGTNAHVVLEEAPAREVFAESRSAHLLLLSAKTEAALETMTANLATHLEQHPELQLSDVAYTSQVGRKALSKRRMLVSRESAEALHSLRTRPAGRFFTSTQEVRERPIAFLFPGQGSQYALMAAEIYREEPIFREELDHCTTLLKPLLGRDPRELLYSGIESHEAATQQLAQTAIAQPLLFAVEYALARQWMAWGIHPQAMIGHSLGEYVAACLAGVFSLEDALPLVARRGQLMQTLPEGCMLSVSLPESELTPFLSDDLSLAITNGSALCVVAGSREATGALKKRLTEQSVHCRDLSTTHAFHSAMVEPIMEPFAAYLATLSLRPPQISYISNVTGTWITPAEAISPAYWVRHLRQTVRFAEGLQTLLEESERILLEVGPGQTLTT